MARRPPSSGDPAVLRARAPEMSLLSRRVARGGTAIELQPREFALIEHMLRRKGRVQTRTILPETVCTAISTGRRTSSRDIWAACASRPTGLTRPS
ncbi:hypothetical protein [Mangrovicoccus ximenensis]|uniref:hypothetical protein n=1 Tax=Mangrovicoccus ximenensis TaxID=1911570 RepID=UPI0038B4106A